MKPIWIETDCPALVHDQVSHAALSLGLVAKEMGMKSPPGARHWHISKPGSKGTIEITWLPSGRLTIEARANRFADWQLAVAEQLVQVFGSEQ